MRIQYTYSEYKDFPEATEISRTRNGLAIYLFGLDFLLFLASIFALIIDFKGCWPALFALAGSIAWFIYLWKYYNKATEKKIQRAINKQLQQEKEKAEAKLKGPDYNCKSIKIVSQMATGRCYVCGESNGPLSLCDIKYNKDNSVIPLCNKCLDRFQPANK